MECSEEDICTIAEYDFDWRRVGRRLIGDQKTTNIDNERCNEENKRDRMLLKWKESKARDATFGALVKVLRDLGNKATADRVKELERKKKCQVDPEVALDSRGREMAAAPASFMTLHTCTSCIKMVTAILVVLQLCVVSYFSYAGWEGNPLISENGQQKQKPVLKHDVPEERTHSHLKVALPSDDQCPFQQLETKEQNITDLLNKIQATTRNYKLNFKKLGLLNN